MRLKFKKILGLIMAFHVLSLGVSVAFAQTDYDNSWAANDIKMLIDKGIINENNGNVYPDRPITRAELVKIINRAFSYTEEDENNFPDVSPQSWYFSEFKIAKKQGYIKGDSSGNANPDANITRGEVAVIIARILKLTKLPDSFLFTDDALIPSWCKDEIYALRQAKIILGYPDLSFGAGNSMTRAEAFGITNITINYNNDTPDTPVSTPSVPGNIAPTIISGGGGGGGGGQTVSESKTVYNPTILQFNKTDRTLKFKTVSNAVSYTITAVSAEGTNTQSISEAVANKDVTVNLNDLIKSVTQLKSTPEMDVTIKIKVNAASGYTAPLEHTVGVITMLFPFLDTPILNVVTEQLPTGDVVCIYWNEIENAYDYSVEFLTGDVNKTAEILVNKASRVAVIKNLSLLSGDDAKIKVGALSNSESFQSSAIAEVAVGADSGATKGSGTEADPYIIQTAQDFELIRDNRSMHFILTNDIDLGSSFVPIPKDFTGSLKGWDLENGKLKKRSIRLAISRNEVDVGIFKQLSGNAVIDSIVVEGSIIGGSNYTAGITAQMTGSAQILNCVNKASINGGSNVGGIAGYVYTGTPKVQNCSNLGNVTGSSSNVGGVVAYANLGTAVAVENCSNYGTVKGTGNLGGIMGAGYAPVTKSFNAGNIVCTNAAGGSGGVVGITATTADPVTLCYNIGTVEGGIYAGGVVFSQSSSGHSSISNCYNAGLLKGSTENYPISRFTASSSFSNNFYLTPEEHPDYVAGPIYTDSTGATALTLLNLTTQNDDIQPLLNSGFQLIDGYDFPQIPTNLYGIEHLNLPPETVLINYNSTSIFFDEIDDDRIIEYEITIINKDTYDIEKQESITAGNSDITVNFTFAPGIVYEIIVASIDADGNRSGEARIFTNP